MVSEAKYTIWTVLKQSFSEFIEDKCPRLGAALAYYTIFSIAPLLVIAIGIFGWVMGNGKTPAGENPIVQQVTNLIGGDGGEAIKKMVTATAENHRGGILATILGFAVLLFGATAVFGQLQDALNTIWEVAPKPGRGVWGFIRDRFLSFAMVAGVCFLLLVSMIVSAGLSAVHHFVDGAMGLHYLWVVLNFIVSVAVVSAMFAMMFKVLPDVKMKWKDTLIGAITTAILFGVGKWGIGVYLGKASVGSTYGAVGSLVVLLLWVYYSSQIFLLGAEFTHVYACRLGSKYVTDESAVQLSERQRIREGIPHDSVLEGIEARKSAKPLAVMRIRAIQKAPRRALPMTIGFVLGFTAAKMRRIPKVKKLMLGRGVRIVERPSKDFAPRASTWSHFLTRLHR